MSTDFASLSLSAPLLKALAEQGYTAPTPIQAQTIPPLLLGRDVLGCAQTGTGKTAAFALPLLHRLLERKAEPKHAERAARTIDSARARLPRALVLAPTRELATQIVESFATYGRHTPVRTVAVYGGVSQVHQVKALERGVDVLVATPGRLIDLMDQRLVRLNEINALVLDEADRMLDMGFIAPIRRIVASLPKERQTLLFSATMPTEIRQLANAFLRDPVTISVTPVASLAPKIEQALYRVNRTRKQTLLEHLIEAEGMSRALVFTKTKHGADRVAKKLTQRGISADAIHGNKAQNRRQRTLDSFRDGTIRVLVATDVAARGLDVDGVSHVVNFDLSMEPEAHVHRIGRTGRAGATGVAISFCDEEESDLLRQIEKLTKSRLPERTLPHLPTPTASEYIERPARRDGGHVGAGHDRQRGDNQRGDRHRGDKQRSAARSAGNGRGSNRSSTGAASHTSHRHESTSSSAAPAAKAWGIGMRGRSQRRGR